MKSGFFGRRLQHGPLLAKGSGGLANRRLQPLGHVTIDFAGVFSPASDRVDAFRPGRVGGALEGRPS